MENLISQERVIALPSARKEDWREAIPRILIKAKPGLVELDCRDWKLSCRDLKKIISFFEKAGLKINLIRSNVVQTLVSASALGHQTVLRLGEQSKSSSYEENNNSNITRKSSLLFHEGTLRAGEHLEADGDVLLVGDVNPGAKISSGGNVMVWGRLRGSAHAGKFGNQNAKIVALQLRPLQLRIANEIARGPEEKPQEGLAEEAIIESGQIIIQPAKTNPLP